MIQVAKMSIIIKTPEQIEKMRTAGGDDFLDERVGEGAEHERRDLVLLGRALDRGHRGVGR